MPHFVRDSLDQRPPVIITLLNNLFPRVRCHGRLLFFLNFPATATTGIPAVTVAHLALLAPSPPSQPFAREYVYNSIHLGGGGYPLFSRAISHLLTVEISPSRALVNRSIKVVPDLSIFFSFFLFLFLLLDRVLFPLVIRKRGNNSPRLREPLKFLMNERELYLFRLHRKQLPNESFRLRIEIRFNFATVVFTQPTPCCAGCTFSLFNEPCCDRLSSNFFLPFPRNSISYYILSLATVRLRVGYELRASPYKYSKPL